MPRSIVFGLIPVGLIACACSSPLSAVPPSASYIFPAGAQRGTTVEVRVGGLYLHDGCNFEMLGPQSLTIVNNLDVRGSD